MNTKTRKSKNEEFDLGNKNVNRTFRKILIPTVIAQIIAGTFVVFDTFFISLGYHGGIIGTMPESATGYSQIGIMAVALAIPYTLIIISIGLLIGGGLASKMTKEKAAGDNFKLQKSMDSFLPTVVFYGAITTLILFFGAKFFVWMGVGFQPDFLENWFNGPIFNSDPGYSPNPDSELESDQNLIVGQAFAQAAWYLRIQALGAIPYIYMVSGQVILRVEGKANVATKFTSLALITNITLDAIFIVIFGLNLVGAALATVIAQIIAASLYYWYYKNKYPLTVKSFNVKGAKEDFGNIAKGGFSTMFLQVSTAIIVLSSTMSIGFTHFGDIPTISTYIASFQGYYSFYMFTNLIVIGIAQSMMPIVTYNYERKDYQQVKDIKKTGFTFGVSFAIIVTLIAFFVPNIVGVFGFRENDESTFYAQRIIQILFSTFFIGSFLFLLAIYFQSVGESKKSNFIIFSKSLLLFPIMLFTGFAFSFVTPIYYSLPWAQSWNVAWGTPESLSTFWGLPAIELMILPIVSIWFWKDNHKINDLIKNK